MMLGFQASYSQNSCDFDKRFFFFFFFSSDQPTEKKETHSTLNEEKGDGLTEVKKKNTVFVSAESRALQSRHFVESGCLWIHVLNFPKC